MITNRLVTKLVKIINASKKRQSDLSIARFRELKPLIREYLNRKVVDIINLLYILDITKDKQEHGLLHTFKEIKPKLQEYIESETAHRRHHAPDWNVFSVIGIEGREVEFHTPFLYGLLNPYGNHGQGRLFLDGFLKMISNKVKGLHQDDITSPYWYVERETEQINLRIYNDRLEKGFYIENKIYAGVRSGQLSRHAKLWLQRYKDSESDGGILYLTIHGDEPPESAFDFEGDYTRSEIEQKMGKIKTLSYRRDISGWLTATLESIVAQRLKQSIVQYLEIINELGGM